MSNMFRNAENFNQDLSYWNMSNIKKSADMFTGSTCSIKNCLR